MLEDNSWGGFFKGMAQTGLQTAVQYSVADQARDNGFVVPAGNPFAPAVALAPSPTANASPQGKSMITRVFYSPNGQINPLAVGISALAVYLVVK